jgi:hypothetical protein
MADMTANATRAAHDVRENISVTGACARSDALTGTLLFVVSVAAGLLFIAETTLGILWALDCKPYAWLIFTQ